MFFKTEDGRTFQLTFNYHRGGEWPWPERGYYARVAPCEIMGNCIRTYAGNGVRWIVKTVRRASNKAEAEALEAARAEAVRIVEGLGGALVVGE